MLREVGFKSKRGLTLLYAGGLAAQTLAYTLATIVVVWFFFTLSDYNDEFYTVETDYLNWVTRVPAFTVCPVVSGRFAARQLKRYSKATLNNPQNISFFTNLLRPGKSFCPGCPTQWPHGLPEGNLSSLVDVLAPPCESLLLNCQWNEKSFPCCHHFQRIITKHGVCYTLNNDQTDRSPIDMVTSYLMPEAELTVETKAAFNFHITDRKQVYFTKPRFPVRLGYDGKVYYKFVETIALDSAWEMKASHRKCILQGEVDSHGYNQYSFTSCKVAKLRAKQAAVCGCRHHLLGGEEPECDTQGLMCLDRYFGNKTKSKFNCKHACDGQEINFVYASINRTGYTNKARIKAILTQPPSERVIYYAQTTYLEKIVGFACLTRLVTSASLYDAVIAFWNAIRVYTAGFRYLYRKTRALVSVKESID